MPCMKAKNLEYEYTILYLHDVKYHMLERCLTEVEEIIADDSNKYIRQNKRKDMMHILTTDSFQYPVTVLISDDIEDINSTNLTEIFSGHMSIPNKYLSLTNSSEFETPYLNFPVESESCKVRIWMDELEYGAERVEIFIEPIEKNK